MDAEEIFTVAIEEHSPSQWGEYVRRVCGDDRALFARVTSLLAAHCESHPLIDGWGLFNSQTLRVLERPGDTIGPYRLLEEIGEGGFGVIYLAQQFEPMQRKVALKVLKPGLDSRPVIARFEAERQALALMEHPGIASVFDGGLTPSGRPFFVMELVRGLAITDYCDQRKLSLPRRLKLLVNVCHAVHHAHLKGVIHRDLKPSNVMITECDGKAIAKVIDFGIAKAIGQVRLTDKSLHTNFSQFIGTPAYMSPEQAALSAVDVDVRSDVYALGILLYELVTGTPPVDVSVLQDSDYDTIRRTIREVIPRRPSAQIGTLQVDALQTLSENCQSEPNMFRKQIRPELDWIVMKALEKDRARRYQSASAFADDLEAFLAHDKVAACPPSYWYLTTKLAQKHRIALITSSLVFATLLFGFAMSLWQATKAWDAHRLEQQARQEVVRQKAELRQELYASDMASAWRAWNDGEIARAKSLLNRYVQSPQEEDLRDFSWRFLNSRCSYAPKILGTHDSPILTAELSLDGHLIASSDRGGTVRIWNLITRKRERSWNYSNKEVTALAFAPDGKLLATAGQDTVIHLWSVADGTEVASLRGHTRTVTSLSWSPDGSRLASGSRDQSIRIWQVPGCIEEICLGGQADVVRCVVWLPDGARLAAAIGPSVCTWQTDHWKPNGELTSHQQGVLSLAVSRHGRYLASGGYDDEIALCDPYAHRELFRLPVVTGIWSLSFSSDERQLLAGLRYGGPSVWELGQSAPRLTAIRVGMERSGVQRAALLTPDDTLLVTATEDERQIRLADASEILGHSHVAFPEDCLTVNLPTDTAICAAPDGPIVVRAYSSGQRIATLHGHSTQVLQATVSPSGHWMASISESSEVLVWNLHSHQLHHRLVIPASDVPSGTQFVFSPDEKLLGVGTQSGAVRIWHVSDGRIWRDVLAASEGVARIAFAPDGNRIATSLSGQGGTIWDLNRGIKLASFGRTLEFWDICFSPNHNELFAAAGVDGAIVCQAPSGLVSARLSIHLSRVSRLAVSPDGLTLATLATDNVLRLWHVPTGRELYAPLNHSQDLVWVQFASPMKILVGARRHGDSRLGVFALSADSVRSALEGSRDAN